MEFSFDIDQVLQPDARGISIISPNKTYFKRRELNEIIDRIGGSSSRAQGLGSVITTAIRFFSSNDNKLYIKSENRKVIGFLKTGYRRLFYSDYIGKTRELYPLCLLDFYVHEDFQRVGYGKELYELFIQSDNINPSKIAIDRPSQKLLSFMKRHYGLADYIPQNNNFIVYRQFFSHDFATKCRENPPAERKAIAKSGPPRNGECREPVAYERKAQKKAPNANVYVSVPPWATSSHLISNTTTSSHYGSYNSVS